MSAMMNSACKKCTWYEWCPANTVFGSEQCQKNKKRAHPVIKELNLIHPDAPYTKLVLHKHNIIGFGLTTMIRAKTRKGFEAFEIGWTTFCENSKFETYLPLFLSGAKNLLMKRLQKRRE